MMWHTVKVSALYLWASSAIWVIKPKHNWQNWKTRDKSLHNRTTFVVETLKALWHGVTFRGFIYLIYLFTSQWGDTCILWPPYSSSTWWDEIFWWVVLRHLFIRDWWQNVCHLGMYHQWPSRNATWSAFSPNNSSSFHSPHYSFLAVLSFFAGSRTHKTWGSLCLCRHQLIPASPWAQ